jgi:type II secretory pathway predicted ATPase ExeA
LRDSAFGASEFSAATHLRESYDGMGEWPEYSQGKPPMNHADSSEMVDLGRDALSEFFRRVESHNPFLDNRINGPSADDVDVDAIHQTAFERLTRLAREACDARRGVGVVLWGEAGIGKSHLLSRLGRWTNRDNQACFVYLHNLQAAPENLPRSLLHAVINQLTLGRSQQLVGTPLYEMVESSLINAVGGRRRRYEWTWLRRAYARHGERRNGSALSGAFVMDRSIRDMLFQFFRSANRAQQGKEDGHIAEMAVRWLSGQALDPREASELGLPPPRPAEEAVALIDNQQIKQVLVELSRVAATQNRPFLLVFDQVDNLDREQVAALARFVEALIDSSPNLLVVTAGVKDTLVRWHQERVIQESAWDRLAQFEITLQRLQPAEATAIVQARLQRFLAPFAGVDLIRKRRQDDTLFPLGEAWGERFIGGRIEIRPRDAINWAREGWRQRQGALSKHDPLDWLRRWPHDDSSDSGPPDEPSTEEIREAVDRKIDDKLTAALEQLEKEPHLLPTDADHLAGVVHALLVSCREGGHRYGVWEVERVVTPKHGRPTFHLSLRQRVHDSAADLRTGVLFLAEQSSTSTAGFLRRLLAEWGTYDRVILATAQDVGLHLGQKGEEYLEDLRRRGNEHFQMLEISFAECAQLEALQRVVGLAKSGDLEIEARPGHVRPVSEHEVTEAYHRRGRYLASRLLWTLLEPAAKATKNKSEPLTL